MPSANLWLNLLIMNMCPGGGHLMWIKREKKLKRKLTLVKRIRALEGVNFDPWSSRFWNFDPWSSALKFWSTDFKFWYLIQDFGNFDTGIPKFWSNRLWNFDPWSIRFWNFDLNFGPPLPGPYHWTSFVNCLPIVCWLFPILLSTINR